MIPTKIEGATEIAIISMETTIVVVMGEEINGTTTRTATIMPITTTNLTIIMTETIQPQTDCSIIRGGNLV